MTTTISEQATIRGVDVDSIRWHLFKNKIEPIEKKKWVLRGYTGRPYKSEDIDLVMKGFRRERCVSLRNVKVEKQKAYSQLEVCLVLRKHIKSYLNNKLLRDWNQVDWKEFNKLKNGN